MSTKLTMIKHNVYKLALLSAVALLATGCSSETDEVQDNGPKSRMELNAEEEGVCATEVEKAFSVFGELYTDANDRENVLLSPISLDLCLGMTTNAFIADDCAEIVRKLGASSATALNEFNKNRINYFSYNGKRAKVTFANSVWANSLTMKSEQEFATATEIIKKFYDAECRVIDFGTNNMKSIINDWCSDKTNGLIPGFLKDAPSTHERALFINAMYFDCQWKDPFKRSRTKTESFYSPDGSRRRCGAAMMSDERDVAAIVTKDYSMFALPYADCNYSAVFVLPDKSKRIADILPAIKSVLLSRELDKVSQERYLIFIPRFNTEFSRYITQYVSDAGIDLSNRELLGYGLVSPEILQATRVMVNEEGTKIATATGTTGTIAPRLNIIRLDRPFMMIVKDNNHGSILLMAAIQMPKE